MQDARLIWAKGKPLSEYFQSFIGEYLPAQPDVPDSHSSAPLASSLITATASAFRIHAQVQARNHAIEQLREKLICGEIAAFGRFQQDSLIPVIEHVTRELCVAVEFYPERSEAISDRLQIDLIKIVSGDCIQTTNAPGGKSIASQTDATWAQNEVSENAPAKIGPKGDKSELRRSAIAAAYERDAALFEMFSGPQRVAIYMAWIRQHHLTSTDGVRGLGDKSFEKSETGFKRSIGIIPLKSPISG